MIWEALLYTLGTGAGACMVCLSRRPAGVKRWDDAAFLQGWGLIAWGAGHLLAFIPAAWVRMISLSLCLCFSLLFLLALHALFAPFLCHERWKTVLDAMMLCAMLGTSAVCLLLMPDMARHLAVQMALQSGFLLLLPTVSLALANRRMADAAREERQRLLAATLLFTALAAAVPFLPPALLFGAGAASLGFLCRSHQRRERGRERSLASDDCTHTYERLIFSLHDTAMVAVLLAGTVVAAVTVAGIPRLSLIGMGLGALAALARLALTIRANRILMGRAFWHVGSLERKFAEQLEQIRRKNAQMAQLLQLKQRYEQLLIVSNEQSMREVSYENLQQVIEELVDTWFTKMDTLLYLRLSLESADGVVYYESVRGNPDHPHIRHTVVEQIVVDEQRDSPLAPRYVVVLAKTAAEEADEREMEHPFYQLLAVNVRGLVLRCLHENQSLELRLMEQEMELARRIQLLLIPEERMVLPRLQAKAVYLPVAYVGGDYVDYVRIDQRYTCFVVADASGHGLPASLMANGMRSALRAVIQTCWESDSRQAEQTAVCGFEQNALVHHDADRGVRRGCPQALSQPGGPSPAGLPVGEQGRSAPLRRGLGPGAVARQPLRPGGNADCRRRHAARLHRRPAGPEAARFEPLSRQVAPGIVRAVGRMPDIARRPHRPGGKARLGTNPGRAADG